MFYQKTEIWHILPPTPNDILEYLPHTISGNIVKIDKILE